MESLNEIQIVTGKMEIAEKKLVTKEERISKLEQANNEQKEKQQSLFNLVQQLKQELSRSNKVVSEYEFLRVSNLSDTVFRGDESSRNSVSGGNGMSTLNPFRRGTIMGGRKGLVKSSSEAVTK